MTFPFETIKITSIDRYCTEIAAVVYDTPVGKRCIKICRTDEALRRVHIGDTVTYRELGEQWSKEYMEAALNDYCSEDNEDVPLHPVLAAAVELWCFDRGISFADFCLALSVFLCDHRTDALMHELYTRWHKADLKAGNTPEILSDERAIN